MLIFQGVTPENKRTFHLPTTDVKVFLGVGKKQLNGGETNMFHFHP